MGDSTYSYFTLTSKMEDGEEWWRINLETEGAAKLTKILDEYISIVH